VSISEEEQERFRKAFEQIETQMINAIKSGKTIHDVFCKQMMEQKHIVIPFLQQQMPKQFVDLVKWEDIKTLPTTFLDDLIPEKRVDLLFQLPFGNDKVCYAYLLFEHQSTSTIDMPWRFYEYMFLIWKWVIDGRKQNKQQLFPLPMIFPFVLHNGLEPWKYSTQFADLVDIPKGLEEYSPRFQFQLYDLPDVSDADLKTYKPHFELYKFLQYFKHGRKDDFVEYLQNDLVELRMVLSHEGHNTIKFTLYFVGAAPKKQKDRTIRFLQDIKKQGGNMERVSEIWKEQGRKEGLKQGEQKGRKEGHQEGEKIGVKKGRKEGERGKQIAIAKNMISMKLSLQTIAQATGLTIDEIKELQN
tara:strand:+ start:101 stop:1174 length:1074 start_codon:yes stop_codon:yes gene_type:complete